MSTECLLDAQQLVVLGGAFAAAGRTCFDLSGTAGNRKVGNDTVLGLAGAVGEDGSVSGTLCQPSRLQRLGERPDLIGLEQDSVGSFHADALPNPLGIGDKQVIADNLGAAAQTVSELDKALPVVFLQRVLQRADRVACAQRFPIGNQLGVV